MSAVVPPLDNSHTPGPWRSTSRNIDNEANWACRIPFAIEREAGNAVAPIADVCDQPQAEANARLIAAAPELLEALKYAFRFVDRDRCDWAFIDAAIAKAEGK